MTTPDLDLSAPVSMSRRDALKEAHRHLRGVVVYALDAGLTPDKIDCEHIREAARLVELALKDG